MTEIDLETKKKLMLGVYPGIDETFLNWLIENGYFTAPASTKYHGAHEGGLFDHSFAVTAELVKLTEVNNLKWDDIRSPVVVGLFHDICKMDQYKHPVEDMENTNQWIFSDDTLLKGHGDKSVMILASHIQLTEEEVMCIRYHMGAFTDKSEWNDYTRAIHKYQNVLWTHHADMLASHVMGI